MKVKIYHLSKNLMQSAPKEDLSWRLEYIETKGDRFTEHLMGWTGSFNTNNELHLKFNSKNAAISYAQKRNLDYEVEDQISHNDIKPKSYADNFKFKKFN